MPVAIRSASRCPGARRMNHERASNSAHGSGPGPTARRRRPVLHPAVVVDEAHEPEDETGTEQERQAGELAPGSTLGHGVLQRLLDRTHAVHEHVPEEEDQDPGRERAQRGPQAVADRLVPGRGADRERSSIRRSRRGRGSGSHSSGWFPRICKGHLTVTTRDYSGAPAQRASGKRMAHGHSVDEYLETIYFLAFPIGEYAPPGTRTADARGARRGDARRLTRVGRRDAQAARARRARAARRAQGGAADGEAAASAPSGSSASTGSSSGCSPTSWATRPPRRTSTPTSSATRSATTWSSGSPSGSAIPERCPHGWPVDPDFEQAENEELEALAELDDGHAGDDRPPRRARRRTAPLVLRPGPRAGREAADRRRPTPRRASFRVKLDGREETVAEKAAAGLFVRPS